MNTKLTETAMENLILRGILATQKTKITFQSFGPHNFLNKFEKINCASAKKTF
jgi:hypothetical protein